MKKKLWKNLAVFMVLCMILLTGCKGSDKTSAGSKKSSGNVEALSDVNEIPEDGVITKEQFETVAGEDKTIQFTGTTDDGISYVWTFNAKQIQNPADQNLKINFTTEKLDDIKKEANNATDALKMTMNGKGLICVPTLAVTLPTNWKSDTGLLLKEQNKKLAKMSDVTIDSQTDKKATILSMKVTSLDGDCYVVGGVAGRQNKGAANANADNGETKSSVSGIHNDAASSENGSSGESQSGDTKNGDVVNEGGAPTCTISINCATILDNMDKLTKGKEEFVPSDGVILAPTIVEIQEGESVQDILKRVCKEKGIHMEATYTPAYNSAYVEGINQLYEFDCGELSGWMFCINGWFPNYGSSKYQVSDGDVIEWVYTCNLGKDVGDNSMH